MRSTLASAVACSCIVVVTACTGAIDGSDDTASDAMGAGSGSSVTVDITGPDVLPHVQRFANLVCGTTSACTISTYEGHQPTASRAIDILVSDMFGEVPSDNNALGNRVADLALANQTANGITYVIWRQRYNDGSGWDAMEDRGSITQNHFDHVHVSFDETAP